MASSNLPTETLVSIFHEGVQLALESVESVFSLLVRLSLVCSQWRDIVKDTPSLWSSVLGTESPKALDLFFERSKNTPLDVYYDAVSRSPIQVDAARRIHDHLRRIKSLEIVVRHEDWAKIVPLLCADAPLLVAFSLIVSGPDLSKPPNTLPCVPSDLFGGPERSPKLQHLDLLLYAIDWTSPLLKNLTTLYLHQVPSSRPSYHEFIQALRSMYRLEELVLFGSLPIAFPPDSTDQIHLPLLRLIDLHDDMRISHKFLELVQCTPDQIILDGPYPEEIPGFAPTIARRLAGMFSSSPVRFVQLCLERHAKGRGSFTIDCTSPDPLGGPCKVLLSITGRTPTTSLAEKTIRPVIHAFRLSSAREVRCKFFFEPAQSLWIETLFPSFPKLEHIALTKSAIKSFFDSHQAKHMEDSEDVSPPYPQLQEIHGRWDEAVSMYHHVEEELFWRKSCGFAVVCVDQHGKIWEPREPGEDLT